MSIAQEIASVYSSTATRNCKQVDAAKNGEGDWSIWLCPAIGGYVVRVTEDDLRMTVSIGRNLKSAADEPASKHQFAPFNSAHDTLEWRMAKGSAVRDHPALVPRRRRELRQERETRSGLRC